MNKSTSIPHKKIAIGQRFGIPENSGLTIGICYYTAIWWSHWLWLMMLALTGYANSVQMNSVYVSQKFENCDWIKIENEMHRCCLFDTCSTNHQEFPIYSTYKRNWVTETASAWPCLHNSDIEQDRARIVVPHPKRLTLQLPMTFIMYKIKVRFFKLRIFQLDNSRSRMMMRCVLSPPLNNHKSMHV